jgi:hypothetical protein
MALAALTESFEDSQAENLVLKEGAQNERCLIVLWTVESYRRVAAAWLTEHPIPLPFEQKRGVSVSAPPVLSSPPQFTYWQHYFHVLCSRSKKRSDGGQQSTGVSFQTSRRNFREVLGVAAEASPRTAQCILVHLWLTVKEERLFRDQMRAGNGGTG